MWHCTRTFPSRIAVLSVGQEPLERDAPIDVVIAHEDDLAHAARPEELRRLVAAP
jgi:hypothetical protein